jgi:hypothetical protein
MIRFLAVGFAASFLLAATEFVPGAEGDKPAKTGDAGRLDIHGAWSEDGGGIISRHELGDGTKVLHGLQLLVGPRGWVKEHAVFNMGVLESRKQFYANGLTFRHQHREHNGDGYEIIYTAERTKVIIEKVIVDGGVDIGPIKEQDVICRGTVKANQRWEGSFLGWERIPNGFGQRVMMQEYRKGELFKSTPYAVEKLGIPPDPAHKSGGSWAWPWRWQYDSAEWRVPPEWPASPRPARR